MEDPSPPPRERRRLPTTVLVLGNLLIIGGLIVGLWAWARSRNGPSTWTTHQGDGWTIEGPDDWQWVQDRETITAAMPGAKGVAFLLLAPRTSRVDAFRENVNLLIPGPEQGALGLDLFVMFSKGVIGLMPKGRILESTRLAAAGPDGVDAHRLVWTARLKGRDLKFVQVCRVWERKVYVLTFTSRPAEFEHWKATAERILDSFVLEP